MKVALYGAGRIGKVHGPNMAAHPRCDLVGIVDPHGPSATALANKLGASVMTEQEVLEDDTIKAILIGSATDQHAEQIERAARAGKAILCEKPIHLDIERTRQVAEVLEATKVPFMLAFNRRFDPNFSQLRDMIAAGKIGKPEMLTILSRDPAAPPIDYIKVSGGLFRDMMIHDFDMARFLMGEELELVSASGACLVDPAIGAAGDVDTAMVTLRTASGSLVHISNSRRANYGYDQRIEVHGAEGMLQAGNILENSLTLANAQGVSAAKPMHFFLERYQPAYVREWDAFVRYVLDGDKTGIPDEQDGLAALGLAEAALAALA